MSASAMKHIATVTGSFDHIAIGTDFDGMAEPPDDFYDCSMLENFRAQLQAAQGYLGASEADIEKITGGNILRILKASWQ